MDKSKSEPMAAIVANHIAGFKKKKIRTRSYKTELGKMTRERDKWQAIAFSSFISSAIFLAALAYKMFS